MQTRQFFVITPEMLQVPGEAAGLAEGHSSDKAPEDRRLAVMGEVNALPVEEESQDIFKSGLFLKGFQGRMEGFRIIFPQWVVREVGAAGIVVHCTACHVGYRLSDREVPDSIRGEGNRAGAKENMLPESSLRRNTTFGSRAVVQPPRDTAVSGVTGGFWGSGFSSGPWGESWASFSPGMGRYPAALPPFPESSSRARCQPE